MGQKTDPKRVRKRVSPGHPKDEASSVRAAPALPFGRAYLLSLLLVVLTVLVFARVADYPFVNYDDDAYVYDNPHVRSGLTWEGIRWAFSTRDASNWHPMTWLSHMLDMQLFGLNAGRHHCINLMFHCINSVLLLMILFRLTGALWRSAFVAALFSLHPLHVESVAWIAERKDVLSALFFFLTVAAYVRYAKAPHATRYVPVVVLFVLGLATKPMIVTLPFVLLLLDWWPLGRVSRMKTASFAPLVLEKLPLVVLSLAACVATIWAQSETLRSFEAIPFGARIANVSVSCISYLGKALWPASLAIFYQHPWLTRGGNPPWLVLYATILLVTVSCAAWKQARRLPYLIVGWLWFLGMLVPVSGIVQVGSQAMADRYTYVPLIGIFVLIAWGAADLLRLFRVPAWPAAMLGVAALAGLSAAAWSQVGYWESNAALYRHCLEVTGNPNWIANYNLGRELRTEGRIDESIRYFRQALEAAPNDARAHSNVATVLAEEGKLDEAIGYFRKAVSLEPGNAAIHCNLANALAERGDADAAIGQYREALNIDSGYVEAYRNLGNLLAARGDLEGARDNYRLALQAEPDDAVTQNNLGNVFAADKDFDEAISHFREALRIDPNRPEIHDNLGNALASKGIRDEAVDHYREALRIDPNYAEAYSDLGAALAMNGRMDEAITCFREALRLKPGLEPARRYLEQALSRKQRPSQAPQKTLAVPFIACWFPGNGIRVNFAHQQLRHGVNDQLGSDDG
jgi:tetratricopeptide (TPR) repeat protein